MRTFVYVSVLAVVLSVCAQAAIVIESSGSGNPVDAGFSFSGNGTFSTGAGNDGENYWFVNTNRAAYYLYTATAAAFQDPTGWTATWRTKTLLTNSASESDNLLCVRDGGYRWDFSVCGGTATRDPGVYVLPKTGYVRIDAPTIDVSQYHTYQVVYDPMTQSASYYIDGVKMATYLKSQMYTTTLAEMRWGDQYSTTTTAHENRYSLIRLETGQNIIPEPATGLLLLSLSGLLWGTRRKQG